MKRWLTVLGSALLLAVYPVQAQFPSLPWVEGGLGAMKIGSWASYISTTDNKTSNMRFALVGEEKVEGKRGIWYEVNMQEQKEKGTTIKMLMCPENESEWKVSRMIVQQEGEKAMELPSGMFNTSKSMLKQIPLDSENGSGKGELVELDAETLSVNGKSLDCRHYKAVSAEGESSEVWVSRDVPVFSLVRVQSKDTKMELQEWGDSGAESRVTGEPESMMGGFKGMLKGMR